MTFLVYSNHKPHLHYNELNVFTISLSFKPFDKTKANVAI